MSALQSWELGSLETFSTANTDVWKLNIFSSALLMCISRVRVQFQLNLIRVNSEIWPSLFPLMFPFTCSDLIDGPLIAVKINRKINWTNVESYLGQKGWSLSWAETGHSGFPGSLLDTWWRNKTKRFKTLSEGMNPKTAEVNVLHMFRDTCRWGSVLLQESAK